MSSTYTTRLRLTKQGDGDNAGTWGQIVNTVLDLIDDAVGGVSELTMTGSGSVDLTTSVANGASDEARKAVLRFIGVPTANRAVKVPSVEKVYFVHSSVSISADSYHIVIYPDGVSVCAGVTIKPNEKAIVYCDGTNLINLFSNVSALDPSNNLSDLTNVSAALVNLGFTASIGELNALDGLTASVGELNVLDGITATVAELNILDGALIDVTKLNYINDVTSSVQAQLDAVTSVLACVSSDAGLKFIKTYTLSDSKNIVVGASVFSSTYSDIELVFENVLTSSDGIAGYLVLSHSTDDNATNVSGTDICQRTGYYQYQASAAHVGNSTPSKIYLNQYYTTGDKILGGTLKFPNMVSDSLAKTGQAKLMLSDTSAGGSTHFVDMGTLVRTSTAINGINLHIQQVATSTSIGGFTGNVHCYGKLKG